MGGENDESDPSGSVFFGDRLRCIGWYPVGSGGLLGIVFNFSYGFCSGIQSVFPVSSCVIIQSFKKILAEISLGGKTARDGKLSDAYGHFGSISLFRTYFFSVLCVGNNPSVAVPKTCPIYPFDNTKERKLEYGYYN